MTKGTLRQGTIYIIVGLISTGLNYVTFIAAIRMGLHYLVAATISSTATAVAGYFMHRTFTFSSVRPASMREFGSFLSVFAVQYFLSLLGYTVLIGYLRLGPSLAFVINSAMVALVSFTLLRNLTFRRSR